MAEREEDAVASFLQILEEHRKNCERAGKYVEAEIASQRLTELRVHEENRRRESLRSRHIAERLGVEEAHMLEFQQFNIVWDRKMRDYEQHALELTASIKERHAAELAEWQQKTIATSQKRVKFSKELLNLRRIQECLAKQKDYQQAALMKARADNLEAWELEKLGNQKQQDLFLKEGRFKDRQASELEALFKRVQTGREEQKKQRQLDLERLLQRYQNVKNELEASQNLERIRMDKYANQSASTMGAAIKSSPSGSGSGSSKADKK
jgi:hypothetical protein